jgi:hypothetical protein
MGGYDKFCFLCGGPIKCPEYKIKNLQVLKTILEKINLKNTDDLLFWIVNEVDTDYILKKCKQITKNDIDVIKKNIITTGKSPKYKWLENLMLLHKSGVNISIKILDSWNGEFVDNKNNLYTPSMYLTKSHEDDINKYENKKNRKIAVNDPLSKSFYGDGYIVHKVCHGIFKSKYGNFTFNNVYLGITDHKYIEKYQTQDILWAKFFLNDDGYLLESPLTNLKNKNRILKLTHPINKEAKKKAKSG